MKDYQTVSLEQKGQVLTVTLRSRPASPGANGHWELGSLFSELREDNSIRVIVLTGSGGQFKIPPPKSYFWSEETEVRRRNPADMWLTFTGLIRCHQAMAEIEKPIVARVNGDAIGFGQSLAFASDLIVSREDAVFMDHHMAGTFLGNYDGEILPGGPENSQIPGDGGAALVPLFMSPYKAKEYLMLAQPYTAAELARLGIINYAVAAEELDAKVDDIVQRLLRRGAYALARTKRLVNRRIVQHLNLTLDAGAAYEMVTHLQDSEIPTLG